MEKKILLKPKAVSTIYTRFLTFRNTVRRSHIRTLDDVLFNQLPRRSGRGMLKKY